jgi:DNA polymerase-4
VRQLRRVLYAVVIWPEMAKYRAVGRTVRVEMRKLTPIVEPVSIDEAFLDLSGPERLHGAGQQFGLASGSISSSLARIEYSP